MVLACDILAWLLHGRFVYDILAWYLHVDNVGIGLAWECDINSCHAIPIVV